VGVGKDESELFGELHQARRRGAGGGDDDFGVIGSDFGVLVVDVGFGICLSAPLRRRGSRDRRI
jgi:hypothetical protein